MKRYGQNKATEITRKQVNIVFAKAKTGELKVEKWMMKRLYELADYYGYDDNGSIEQQETDAKEIINSIFENGNTQDIINTKQEKWLKRLGLKEAKEIDRNYIGGF